jgi:hypothetical protein
MSAKPWRVREETEHVYIEEDDGATVASFSLRPESAALGLCTETRLKNHQRNRQLRAHVKLMAASPELLEACRTALSHILGGAANRQRAIDTIDAAIFKAEGRQ